MGVNSVLLLVVYILVLKSNALLYSNREAEMTLVEARKDTKDIIQYHLTFTDSFIFLLSTRLEVLSEGEL